MILLILLSIFCLGLYQPVTYSDNVELKELDVSLDAPQEKGLFIEGDYLRCGVDEYFRSVDHIRLMFQYIENKAFNEGFSNTEFLDASAILPSNMASQANYVIDSTDDLTLLNWGSNQFESRLFITSFDTWYLNYNFSWTLDYAVDSIRLIKETTERYPNFYTNYTLVFTTHNQMEYSFYFTCYYNAIVNFDAQLNAVYFNNNISSGLMLDESLPFMYKGYACGTTPIPDSSSYPTDMPVFAFRSTGLWADVYNYQAGTEQQAYNQGYKDGEAAGDRQYYNDGYQAGYDYASSQVPSSYYDNGYQAGYEAGIVDSGNSNPYMNSIFEGIFQVGLLPVNVFLEIFNFEIFGINVSGFVSGLLTMSVIIIIIRFLFGGKKDD